MRCILCDSKTENVVGGEAICTSCQEGLRRCDECGHKRRTRRIISNGKYVCKSCRESLYTKCSGCNTLHREDDLHTVNAMYRDMGTRASMCSECLDNMNRCEVCDNLILQGHEIEVEGTTLCLRCFHESYITCNECEETVRREDSFRGYCLNCASDLGIDVELYPHDYRPEWNLYRTNKDRQDCPLYGIEMEVRAKNKKREAVEKAKEIFGDFIVCVRDGSLNEMTDFEVVTHPASLNFHNEIMDKWNELARYAKGFAAKQCGCHIHVSRNAFASELELAKFMLFFANNRDFIEIIAQRKSNDYWQHEARDKIEEKSKSDFEGSRYVAVNVNNRKTVEIRSFASNLLPERVFKNIQFVDALVKFIKIVSLNKLTTFHFLNFVRSRDYRELYNFCSESIESRNRKNR